METSIAGIKCDAESCDFIDNNVKFEDYDKWLNKPCPKCGSNLLTQEDLDACNILLAMSQAVAQLSPEELVQIAIDMGADPEAVEAAAADPELYVAKVEFNGTGLEGAKFHEPVKVED